MNKADFLSRELPDPESAKRFLAQLAGQHPSRSAKLAEDDALMSDVLTLVSYSPLLAATLLQHPEYFSWLGRERLSRGVRSKDDLLESLARFSMTNSQVEPNVLLARFRRRELMRVFLSDIRRLATVAEITEEISNLADAVLEHALRLARQELDNRYGQPQQLDEKGRMSPAEICIVSLGKLGSKELNYSSDIDLLFIFSSDGNTSGSGSRGSVTNREYFVKLAELVTKIIGHHGGEGSAYRVDLRLRPHGRVGPLAISLADAARYYTQDARSWERQVLIRSRASAGEPSIYKAFAEAVEGSVFSRSETVENALRNVRRSKQQIDAIQRSGGRGFDVKLGKGGIREIEFIAQALQLAYAGRDKWLRAPHTLISLARLSDRGLISERELTELFDSYAFLRRLEHILQMEHGLQTHLVPSEAAKRLLVARRMGYQDVDEFEKDIALHTSNVSRTFERVFGEDNSSLPLPDASPDRRLPYAETKAVNSTERKDSAAVSPHFRDLLARHSETRLPGKFSERDYFSALHEAVAAEADFGSRLGALRTSWSAFLAEIVLLDAEGAISMSESKSAQTRLAEASIAAGLEITKRALRDEYSTAIDELALAVLALGKLGSANLDHESDLDIVLVYDENRPVPSGVSPHEFYSKAAEIFVTTLSSWRREGSLYRVDLRLRPYGKNGPNVTSRSAMAEYMRNSAAIWEWLAYVKLRGTAGDVELARSVEEEIRGIIHARALDIPREQLAAETVRIRMQLEEQRSSMRRSGDIDIKYGPGGMLDIYFAIRYLQLRDNVPETEGSRTSGQVLDLLREKGSLSAEDHAALVHGYRLLSTLDHYIRLTIGRTTKLPSANTRSLAIVAGRVGMQPQELIEDLTIRRIAIRTSFENVLRV